MKTSVKSVLLCGALSVCSVNAWAQGQYDGYVGINYAVIEQSDRFFGGKRIETGDIIVRAGVKVTDWFVPEIRLGTTLQPEENGGLEFGNQYSLTAMFKFQKNFGGFAPYLGVGYSTTKERLDPLGSATFHDWSYAAGFDLGLGERLGLNAELFALTIDPTSNLDRKGPSVGLFYRF